jgi:kinesin family protein 18/19
MSIFASFYSFLFLLSFRYTSLEDSSDLVSQKRSNASLICQENKKKRKVQKPEVLGVQIAV